MTARVPGATIARTSARSGRARRPGVPEAMAVTKHSLVLLAVLLSNRESTPGLDPVAQTAARLAREGD